MKSDHARTVRHALTDARQLCTSLGLLGDRGSFKRQATGILIRCPAHEERDPSCSIHRGQDGTLAVKCHACGFSGDALTLIAKVRGLDLRTDFIQILRAGAELAGLWGIVDELDGTPGACPARPVGRLGPTPNTKKVREPIVDDVYAATAATVLDACPLRGEPDVCAYLERRSIFVEAEARGLGALPVKSRQGALLMHLLSEHGDDALDRMGLCGHFRGHLSAPHHRLVIPWRGPCGRVVALQRRSVADDLPRGVPKYLFPTGRPLPRVPFGVEAFDAALAFHELGGRQPEIVFVEGALDVLSRCALGFHLGEREQAEVVLGLPSATRWCAEWATFARGRVAVIAIDADAAGEQRVTEMARDLYAAGAIDVKRAAPRSGKDWGDQLKESA